MQSPIRGPSVVEHWVTAECHFIIILNNTLGLTLSTPGLISHFIISKLSHRNISGRAATGEGLCDVKLVKVQPQQNHVGVHPAHSVDTLRRTLFMYCHQTSHLPGPCPPEWPGMWSSQMRFPHMTIQRCSKLQTLPHRRRSALHFFQYIPSIIGGE